MALKDFIKAIKQVKAAFESNKLQIVEFEINQSTFRNVISTIENREVTPGVVPRMEKSLKFDVVGESFYQDDLAKLAGGRSGAQVGWQCGMLIAEPSNEYDPNAVAVYLLDQSGDQIDALKVGYLPREVAKTVSQPLMRRIQERQEVVPVLAGLNGGNPPTEPMYGVVLQVFWDF